MNWQTRLLKLEQLQFADVSTLLALLSVAQQWGPPRAARLEEAILIIISHKHSIGDNNTFEDKD